MSKLHKVSQQYTNFAIWGRIAIAFVLFAGTLLTLQLYFLPVWLDISGGLPLIDNESGYTPSEAYQLIEDYGEAGRDYYNFVQITDTLFPFFAGLFWSMLASRLLITIWPERNSLLIIGLYPWLITGFDYAENIGVFLLLRTYTTPIPAIAQYTLFMTNIKTFSYLSSIVLILLFLLIFVLQQIRTKISP